LRVDGVCAMLPFRGRIGQYSRMIRKQASAPFETSTSA
jgi:hypothetical protein